MIPPKNLNQPVIVDAMELAADFIRAYARAMKQSPDFSSVEPVEVSSIKRAAKQFMENKIDLEILESIKIARLVIVHAGRPLMLDDIYELSRARGLRIATKNPKGALGKRLMRHGKLENLVFRRGYGWWPAELPLPSHNIGGQSRN
jgi:hypothetical protein